MSFTEAIELVKQGKKVKRSGWGFYLTNSRPENDPALKSAHFIVEVPANELNRTAKLLLWGPTKEDLDANDWELTE